MNLRFPGQYYDAETNTHYNYFRDYNPGIGRYAQSDPIGLEGGENTYNYVNGNPIQYFDSMGLASKGGDGSASGRGTDQPYKHCRELKPPKLGFVKCKKKTTGTYVEVARPESMPFPEAKSEMCDGDCKIAVGATAVAGYVAWKCVRMIPSLFPPLWPTIIPNALAP